MKIKTLLLLLSLAVAGILYALTFTIFNKLKENDTSLQTLAQKAVFYQKLNDDSRLAQISFQRQIQEWKNILIRGNDAVLFDKHLQSFSDRENQATKIFKDIENRLTDNKFNKLKADIEKLRNDHSQLGDKYREALNSYDKTDLNSVRIVDTLVLGIDRPVSSAMDTQAKKIQEITEQETTQISATITVKYNELVKYLIAAVGLALFLVFMACFLISTKILNLLGIEPAQLNAYFTQLAAGNFQINIAVKNGDSTSVAANTKLMHMKLKNLIHSIKNISNEVVVTTSQIKVDSSAEEIKDALRQTNKVTTGLKQTVEKFNV